MTGSIRLDIDSSFISFTRNFPRNDRRPACLHKLAGRLKLPSSPPENLVISRSPFLVPDFSLPTPHSHSKKSKYSSYLPFPILSWIIFCLVLSRVLFHIGFWLHYVCLLKVASRHIIHGKVWQLWEDQT